VYDLRDRVRTNATPVGSLYYQYDANGNVTSLDSSTANGVSVAYQYDALNRLTNAIDNRLGLATKNTAYGFDTAGNLTRLRYPNGITNLWQYDQRHRLTNLVWKLNSTTRSSFFYKLAQAGNRTNLSETVNGKSRTFSWKYDSLYRLTNETITGTSPTGTITYKLDPVGNRTNRTSSVNGILTTNNSFDVNDWLDIDSVTTNGSAWFDANGNTRTNGATTYLYDWANRLTNSSTVTNIVYDGDGNRVKKVAGGVTNLYLVATVNPSGYAQVMEELTVSGNTTNLAKVYTYGLDLISQRVPNSSTNFFGYDGLGSTRLLLNPGGGVANAFTYNAFGTLIASNALAQTDYLFAGEQWDPHLRLYYNRARMWDPNVGRFWTQDSHEGNLQDPLSLHKYLYAANNPVNNIDPSGQFTLAELQIVATKIAVLAARVIPPVVQGYNRATAAYDAIQDVALVAGILADGDVDDEESEVLFELLDDYVKARVQAHALRVATGAGGKVLGAAAGAAGRMRITKAGIQRTREWYRKLKKPESRSNGYHPKRLLGANSERIPRFQPIR
jgi:RHS repeat-associated protein